MVFYVYLHRYAIEKRWQRWTGDIHTLVCLHKSMPLLGSYVLLFSRQTGRSEKNGGKWIKKGRDRLVTRKFSWSISILPIMAGKKKKKRRVTIRFQHSTCWYQTIWFASHKFTEIKYKSREMTKNKMGKKSYTNKRNKLVVRVGKTTKKNDAICLRTQVKQMNVQKGVLQTRHQRSQRSTWPIPKVGNKTFCQDDEYNWHDYGIPFIIRTTSQKMPPQKREISRESFFFGDSPHCIWQVSHNHETIN